MKSTYDPEIIYDVFDRHGFPVLRIDRFDRGNYAELRTALNYKEPITPEDLFEITNRLKIIQKNEEISIRIVNIDLIHKTMRINIHTRKDSKP
jgi:hypothetical protein